MTPSKNSTFEQNGNDVATEVGKIGALTDELKSETGRCSEEPEEVGNWITAIGKAVLAIFGIGN